MKVAFTVLLVLCTSVLACAAASRHSAVPHGTYRWDVKTLADNPTLENRGHTTIALLSAAPRPEEPCCCPRCPGELGEVSVSGTIAKVKHEADGDLHIILSDGSRTMICEVPDPRNMAPAWRARVTAARAAAAQFRVGQRVTLDGVMFFDKLHDASGAAPNGIELHPVLDVRLP